jgi:hypothetical protein
VASPIPRNQFQRRIHAKFEVSGSNPSLCKYAYFVKKLYVSSRGSSGWLAEIFFILLFLIFFLLFRIWTLICRGGSCPNPPLQIAIFSCKKQGCVPHPPLKIRFYPPLKILFVVVLISNFFLLCSNSTLKLLLIHQKTHHGCYLFALFN